jgi:2',3'-cyclic-nucleotide 2'-phosphodiesterase (5'-nucleotidase family)
MKKITTKAISLFLTLCLFSAMFPAVLFASESYDGKTVVLFTGNLRANVDALPLIVSVKADFEARGAEVILADTGNFLQGSRYAAYDSGSSFLKLMAAAGYDIITLGMYDFAFGTGTLGAVLHDDTMEYGPLGKLLAMNPSLTALSANIKGENDYFHGFAANTVITTGDGLTIGFFGLTDENAANTIRETNLTGLAFTDPQEAASAQVQLLAGCDVVFGLSNALFTDIPGAFMVYSPPVGLSIVPVLGAWVIDNETLEVTFMELNWFDYAPDADMQTAVDAFKATADAAFTQVVFSAVMLDGSAAANHGGETALGRFWADALRWFAVSGAINAYFSEEDAEAGNGVIHVGDEYVVALWNAGNLRDFIYPGEITVQDLRRVLPFPNTVAVAYLTGAELLEQLEASAQGLPYTPGNFDLTASFMHVSGIEYTVDATKPFNPGERFRDRIWHRAESVERVEIQSVNGLPFDEAALYAVITSNANYNGMDISYMLAERPSDTESRSAVTTARVVEQAVMGYIASLPNAAIGEEYAAMQPPPPALIEAEEATEVLEAVETPEPLTRGMLTDMLFRLAGSPPTGVSHTFADVPYGHAYAEAISWAMGLGLVNGVGGDRFAPHETVTRQELAVLAYRYAGSPAVSGSLAFADVGDIAAWAYDAVLFCTANGFMQGVTDTGFAPEGAVTRSAANAVLAHFN